VVEAVLVVVAVAVELDTIPVAPETVKRFK
jgi:hypothetical protein